MSAGSWGGSTWGGLTVAIALDHAAAVGPKLVDVWLTGTPRADSPYNPGDALNPATWRVVRNDSGDSFTVVSATRVSALRYRLQVIEPLGGTTVEHTVSTSTLRAINGTLCVSPREADFFGIDSDQGTQFSVSARPIDIKTDAIAATAYAVGGGIGMGEDGDYQTHSGNELLRKLIIRRLVTPKGAFFHLPNYGLGLPLKLPLRTSRLNELKADIEEQCLLERDVLGAACSITITADGFLVIGLRVRRKVGEEVQFRFQTLPGGVQVI